MNFDDPSLLDAYLDGELDPARRLAVEAALVARPELAARLHDHARVRDWVGALPRPTTSFDLAGPVLGAVAARPPAWLRLLRWRRAAATRPLALASGLAAAMVLVAVALWPSPPADRPVVVSVLPTDQPPPEPSPAPVVPAPAPDLAAANPVVEPAPKPEPAARDDRPDILELIQRPEARRIFLVTDTIDDDCLKRVEETVGDTPRKHANFDKITVSQGIVVDPDHPGEAYVFALVADSIELDRLLGRLHEQFPGQVDAQAEAAPPTLVARLAEVGQVAVVEREPVAPLAAVDDPLLASTHALRVPHDPPAGHVMERVEGGPPPPPTRSPGRPPMPLDGRPADAGRPKAPARPQSPGATEPMVVLVWVTRPPSVR